jgi:predicted acyltransferase
MENQDKLSSIRLKSLDALRGFDMFWIIGGREIFIGIASLTGWPIFQWWAEQLNHTSWHGFLFFDMIFPLFLFIAGISFPFSFLKRIAMNDSRRSIYFHVVKRGVILVLLGIIYNNGINFDFAHLRYGSVLGRIGLAWMLAALIFMNTKLRSRIFWFGALLTGYWFLLLLFPAHDLGPADAFSKEGNLASYIDRLLLPGLQGIHDPEGILSTIPAIGTALLGMFTGEFILSEYLNKKPLLKVLYMVSAAVLLIIIGMTWNTVFPINKNIWTSSFVCFVGGLSLLLFSIFYLVIDVWQYQKWAFFFIVIGLNPITIYLTERIIDLKPASLFFFGGLTIFLPESWRSPVIDGIGITTIAWVFLYFLYKKKIFLKV